MSLITSVCSAVVIVLSVIMTSMSEVSASGDDMAYGNGIYKFKKKVKM